MFGPPTSTVSFFGSGFGTAASAQNTNVFGGFGQSTSAVVPSAFGGGFSQTPSTTAANSFGGFGPQGNTASTVFGGSGFGTTTQMQPSTGGIVSNPNAAQAGGVSAFSGFGTSTQPNQSTGSFFGQTQGQQQQTTPNVETDYAARLAACVQNPFVFGDERDQVLAKFNSTLATLGSGKAWYASNLPPLELNAENVFCKWKSIVFMPKPEFSNEDGVVRLIFNKSGDAVFEVQKELAELLHKLLGDRPNVQVVLDGVNPLPSAKSELMFHVIERQNDGNFRKVPAAELYNFLALPQQAANLKSMLVEDVQTKLSLTKEMEKEYLEKVPSGVSPYSWYQAQKDNPDPENLLPVPVIGFDQIYSLLKKEDALASLSKDVCLQVGVEVKRLEKKVEENKQIALTYQEKLDRLMLRQLRINCAQPVVCRVGQPLTQFETNLAEYVSQLKDVVEGPEKNLKNRAQELNANVRLHDRFLSSRSKRQPRIDLKTLSSGEQMEMGKACDLLINVLDACKEKLREEKELLTRLLYEEPNAISSG